jgi:putative spermidine/putrescine transport system substrate-binding protein
MFYGPSNRAAYEFLSPEVTRKMPTSPAYAALTFEPDAQWLMPRVSELNERFAQWLAG